MPGPPSTAERILETAEGLIQARGYGAFSYADIAVALDIRKASIHYHFPSKGDLARAVVARYRLRFGAQLTALETDFPDPTRRLMRYLRLFQEILGDGDRMCLAGMLASDAASLPDAARAEVNGFFADQEQWLGQLLSDGRAAGQLTFEGRPAGVAAALIAGFEGALLVARARRDAALFSKVGLRLVQSLTGP
jgi:TetR/AcrR family transcriptional repressor of nem operon